MHTSRSRLSHWVILVGSVIALLLSNALLPAGEVLAAIQAGEGVFYQVSVTSSGAELNGDSLNGAQITPDGRYVVFGSNASNLVEGDTNGVSDYFVRDLELGTTERVSLGEFGIYEIWERNASISDDGRFVVYSLLNVPPSQLNNGTDPVCDRSVYLYDRQNQTTERLNGDCYRTWEVQKHYADYPVISGDGRYVAYAMGNYSSNRYLYVYDRETGTTEEVIGLPYTRGFSSFNMSGNGRFLTYASTGPTSYLQLHVYDRETDTSEIVSVSSEGVLGSDATYDGDISLDGRYVVFTSLAANLVPGDTNGKGDVFLRDRQTGVTERINLNTDGSQATYGSMPTTPSITDNGLYVMFYSDASNLPGNGLSRLFLYDRTAQTLVNVPNSRYAVSHQETSVSGDGTKMILITGENILGMNTLYGARGVYVYDTDPDLPPPTYSISGMVTESGTGLAGVTLTYGQGQSIQTGADGSYTFTGLEAGTYTLVPTKTGYTFTPPLVEVTLVDTDVTGVDFTAASVEPQFYTVSGRILYGDGMGVAGVSISDGIGHAAITNDDGDYTLAGLPPGNYTLTPSRPGFTFTPASLNVTITDFSPFDQNFTGSNGKAWTLMYYIAGDEHDISAAYTRIFNRLEFANNPEAQVVVLLDQLGEGDSAYYLIQHDQDLANFAAYTENVNRWSSRGELNMSNKDTLIEFANWSRANFPAQNYALILDGHGNGLKGAMSDSLPSRNILSVRELGLALDQITQNGAHKIDVLAMNACLMGMVEDAYEWYDTIRYYVASENLQNTYYDGYTRQVNLATASVSPAQFAVGIVDSYVEDPMLKDLIGFARFPYTMSVADMAKMNGLILSINQLSAAIRADLVDDSASLTWVIERVQRFNNTPPYNTAINREDTYADLYDFARLVESHYQDQTVKDAAQSLMNAIDSNYIIYKRNASIQGVGNSHGVSILLPNHSSSYYTGANYAFAQGTTWANLPGSQQVLESTVGWGQMLADYFNLVQPSGPDDPEPPDAVSKPETHFLFIPLTVRQ